MRFCCFLALLLPAVAFASPEDDVGRVLDTFHQAAANSDYDKYFNQFASDGVFLGTDASERWDVEAFKRYAKPAFDAGRGWRYKPRERHVTISEDGRYAWFDEVLVNSSLGLCRGDGVLEQQQGEWKIRAYNLTMLVPNEIALDVGRQTMKVDGLAAEPNDMANE
ncbi:MAG: nuclear transport factor 2 family protein [Pseudomonadales bacterium]|nr:nuclear transport factor 2 family protein [Pseudomonadales bacterium]